MNEEKNNEQIAANEGGTAKSNLYSEADEQASFDEWISDQSTKAHNDNPKPSDQIGVIDSIKMLKREHELAGKLKALTRDIDDLKHQIKKNTDTYNDNRDILENFDDIVGEQREIVSANRAEMDDLGPKMKKATAAAAAAAAAVVAAKADLNDELEPYKSQKESHQDRINELQDKLDSIERDIRNASDDDSQTSALEGRKGDIEENISFENEQISSIENQMNEISRRHDAIIDPLLAADVAAAATLSDLQSRYSNAEKAVKSADDRIKYCEHVKGHPEETDQLKDKIEEEKQKTSNLEAEKKKYDAKLTDVKAATKKGKIAIGVAVAILAVAIVSIVLIVNLIKPFGDSVIGESYERISVGGLFTMDIPDFDYEFEDSGFDEHNAREIQYSSTSPLFGVGVVYMLDASTPADKNSALNGYDRLLSSSAAIERGSFQKGSLIGSMQFLPEGDPLVKASNAATETLVFLIDGTICMVKFDWVPDNEDSLSNEEGKAIAQKCIDSIEPVVPGASSLAPSSD